MKSEAMSEEISKTSSEERDREIWRHMTRIFWFDEFCHEALQRGEIECFTYLSSGQEAVPAALGWNFRDTYVNLFCQHRNHGAYLAFGGDPARLRDELRGLSTGTTGGIGGDPCHHFENDRVKMWGHDGLVGTQVPIGVGMAYATGQWSIIFIGDATVEEDYFWPAVGFAVDKKLPVLFVCENNDLSVITRVQTRRKWSAYRVASAFGVSSWFCDDDVPYIQPTDIELPTFLEVFCERRYRHVGPGTDGPMKHDRVSEMRAIMAENLGLEAKQIEEAAYNEMEALWADDGVSDRIDTPR